jgi:hypothetical protein
VNKSHLISALSAASALLAVSAQAQKADAPIYSGQSVKEHGIKLGGWGSGSALESEENSFAGPNVIKVTTHGPYQGARLTLDKPLDIKAAAADPTAYLQFTYLVKERSEGGSLGGGPEAGPLGGRGRGGLGPGGVGSGGNPGAPGGRGGAGGYGQGPSGGDVKLNKPKAISNLRVVLVTTDNKRLDTRLALENSRIQRDLWRGLAIPVAGIKGLKESSGELKEILVFADNPGVILLGEIRILRDDTPIRVDDLNEQTIAKNDTVTFTAGAEAGPTPLKYDWVIQGVPNAEASARSEVTAAYSVTGEGRTFKHQFRKSGDYTVTLTVSDVNGLKKAVTTKTNIHVTL